MKSPAANDHPALGACAPVIPPSSRRGTTRWRSRPGRALLIALCLLAASALWTVVLDARPDLLIQWRATERFDGARALADVRSIVADGTPRAAGTTGARAGADRIAALLEDAGVEVQHQQVRIERGLGGGPVELQNLIAQVHGTGGDRAAPIVVVAHSDSVPAGPGAGDDAAGVAALVGIARALRERPPQHDILLLVTDGEERGLLGAKAFAMQHEAAAPLRAAVNLDARGAAGPAHVFEMGTETAWLSALMADALSAPRTQSLAVEAYRRMPNGTDFTVFLRAGLTGYNIAFIGDVAAYHTELDTPDRLNPHSLTHMGQTALELVRGLDARLPPAGSTIVAGGAVFGDIAGLWMLRWPERLSLAIAASAAFLLCFAGVWQLVGAARRRGERQPGRGAALALAVACVVVVASGAIAWLLGAIGTRAGITLASSPNRVLLLNAAAWGCAGIVLLGAAAVLLRRGVVGQQAPARLMWDALLGVWMLWATLAGVTAVLVPGICMPLVLPLAAVGVVAAASTIVLRRADDAEVRSCRAACWTSVAGVGATAILWVPLESAFYDAFGMVLAPFNGARAALVLLALLPLVVGTLAVRKSPGVG